MKKRIAIILTIITALMITGCAVSVGEDGQNPAMEVIGNYQDTVSQRATMSIALLEKDKAEVTIRWANGAQETVEWHFSGKCVSGEGMTIKYKNCTKKIITTAEDGTTSEKPEYENGTGKLVFDGNNSNPVWTDDQENAGASCKFAYAPVNNTTGLNGVEMGDNEAAVREKMGLPANETETAGMKDLVYNDVPVAGHAMEVHFLISDEMVRAFRVVTHEGGSDVASDISMLMEDMSNGSAPRLPEEKIKSIAEKYCGITDFSQLGYFDRFAGDGCMMIYIRSSEKDIDMVILDHFLQFREE